MTEIRKNVKLTAKDFVTQQLTAYLGSFTRNLGFVLMTALFVFMIYYYKTTNTQYWLMVFSGLPPALYIALIVYFIPKAAREDFEHSSYKDFTPLFVLKKDALSIERKSGTVSDIKLSDLLSVLENSRYFYFFITKSNILTLPKRQLDKEEISFVRKIISQLPRKKRKNPFKIKLFNLIAVIASFVFVTFMAIMIIWAFKNGK